MTFTGVILAGGTSSRMGSDKAFLEYHGEPLIRRGVRVVRESGAREVLISGRRGQDFSGFDCPVLFDNAPGLGPLGGVERALEMAQHPLVFVMAVDLPRITPALIQWLETHCSDHMGAVPQRGDQLEPLAAIYPRNVHALLRQRLEAHRFAARGFAADCIRHGCVVPVPVSPADEVCFTNWNHPDDIAG